MLCASLLSPGSALRAITWGCTRPRPSGSPPQPLASKRHNMYSPRLASSHLGLRVVWGNMNRPIYVNLEEVAPLFGDSATSSRWVLGLVATAPGNSWTYGLLNLGLCDLERLRRSPPAANPGIKRLLRRLGSRRGFCPDGRRLFRVVQILGAAGRRRRELTKVNDRA